jgi:hypothetical protein
LVLGTNSVTVPDTLHWHPTNELSAEEVKTNTPSDVAGSASTSTSSSWRKNPSLVTAVTTPTTVTV